MQRTFTTSSASTRCEREAGYGFVRVLCGAFLVGVVTKECSLPLTGLISRASVRSFERSYFRIARTASQGTPSCRT